MSGGQFNYEAPVTPVSPATAEAALACVRRCCPPDVVEVIAAMLGLDT